MFGGDYFELTYPATWKIHWTLLGIAAKAYLWWFRNPVIKGACCPCSIMDLFEFSSPSVQDFIHNIPTTLLKFPIFVHLFVLAATYEYLNPRSFMWHFSPLVYKSGFGICFCTTYVASSLAFDKHSSGDAKHSTPQLKRFSSHTGEQNPNTSPCPISLPCLLKSLKHLPPPKCGNPHLQLFRAWTYTPRKPTFSHLKIDPWKRRFLCSNPSIFKAPATSCHTFPTWEVQLFWLSCTGEQILPTEWLVPQFLSVSFRNHGHGASSEEASGASPTHCLTDFFGGKNGAEMRIKESGESPENEYCILEMISTVHRKICLIWICLYSIFMYILSLHIISYFPNPPEENGIWTVKHHLQTSVTLVFTFSVRLFRFIPIQPPLKGWGRLSLLEFAQNNWL